MPNTPQIERYFKFTVLVPPNGIIVLQDVLKSIPGVDRAKLAPLTPPLPPVSCTTPPNYRLPPIPEASSNEPPPRYTPLACSREVRCILWIITDHCTRGSELQELLVSYGACEVVNRVKFFEGADAMEVAVESQNWEGSVKAYIDGFLFQMEGEWLEIGLRLNEEVGGPEWRARVSKGE